MKNKKGKIKISEIFLSLQGEGKYAGTPMLFIRTYGCTKRCPWCDSRYAIEGSKYKEMTVNQLVKIIKNYEGLYICWTGGEPLLQRKGILEVMLATSYKNHHLETNGDVLIKEDFETFEYLAISPKDKQIAIKVVDLLQDISGEYDIKVVTDLDKIGKDLIPYATMLMPLSTYNKKKDLQIQRKVWNYCIKYNFNFTPRYQYWIWGKKRGI